MGSALTVICGPTKSEKTEEMKRRVRGVQFARLVVQVFQHEMDAATHPLGEIRTRGMPPLPVEVVANSAELWAKIQQETAVIFVDGAHFFDDDQSFVRGVEGLLAQGKVVVISGLDLDYRGRPFESMAYFLARVPRVGAVKLDAVCALCGNEHAHRTQRLIDGRPAVGGPRFLLEGNGVIYEPRCEKCFQSPLGG